MKAKFKVMGMHCSSCSSHVEKSVSSIDGMHSCSVNLLQESMLVDYDETKVTNEQIIKTIQDGGFDASVVNKEVKQKSDQSFTLLKKRKRNLILSFVLLIPLMYLSMGPMLGLANPMLVEHNLNMIIMVGLQCFFTILIFLLNFHYFRDGFKMLIKRTPSMDSLIALGSTSAFVYSFYMWIQMILNYQIQDFSSLHEMAHNMYFESAAMILTLISLGKYLEDKSKKRTSEAVYKLMDLAPKNAIVIRDEKEIEIEVEDILVDDIIIIKPGVHIPVDGVIIEGTSSIDESSISGESIPLEKGIGDEVISGTFNTTGAFKMQAKRVGDETTLAQIIQLVEDANSSKPELAKLADKVSGIFVPIVIVIALITFTVWLLLGYPFAFALSCGIAVLVISCPCALGLATPTAIMVGSGKAAENGILLKRSESLEQIHAVDVVILDKTGTITFGKPSVTTIISDQPSEVILQIAASIEVNSEHPLSYAILEYAKQTNIKLLKASEFEAITGRGAKAKVNDIMYYAGNKKLMLDNKIQLNDYEKKSESYALMGQIPIFIANDKEVIGMISLSDQIKPTSAKAIKKMKALGLKVMMVTGDNKLTSTQIQKQLDLDEVIAEVLPQDKEQIVKSLQKEGSKVMMVGDGVNDAPALTRADVGIAIGAGSDIALECADVVLIKNDLLDVLNTITLSNAVIRNIKQNLFWAFFYNVIGIPLAAGLFYIPFAIQLNPMFGAAAMSLSSICVVTNALRLKRLKMNH